MFLIFKMYPNKLTTIASNNIDKHGDMWHGNPKLYDPDDFNPVSKVKYGMLMKKTIHKELILRNLGYKYECIWEYEWK